MNTTNLIPVNHSDALYLQLGTKLLICYGSSCTFSVTLGVYKDNLHIVNEITNEGVHSSSNYNYSDMQNRNDFTIFLDPEPDIQRTYSYNYDPK